MGYEAVLFDLDGTLVDSLDDIAAACNFARSRRGLLPHPRETLRSFVGDGARWLVARSFGLRADEPKDSEALDDAMRDFREFYRAHPADHAVVAAGAAAMLTRLAPLPMAVVTNKSRALAVALLEATALLPHFRVVRGGGDGALKPAPDLLVSAMAAMGVSPFRTVMVGDGHQDLDAGRAAGCVTVAVRGGFGSDASLEACAPDFTLARLAELPALLRL